MQRALKKVRETGIPKAFPALASSADLRAARGALQVRCFGTGEMASDRGAPGRHHHAVIAAPHRPVSRAPPGGRFPLDGVIMKADGFRQWMRAAGLVAVLSLPASGALAQDKYPSRPIRMVLCCIGAIDAVARATAEDRGRNRASPLLHVSAQR